MDVNGEDNTSSGRWEVVEVVQECNPTRGLHANIIYSEALSPQDVKVNVDDPPQITENDTKFSLQTSDDGGGTVTYRVVHVTPDITPDDVSSEQSVTSSAALVAGQPVAQAIIANTFTAANGGTSPNADGPFYVMMSPQDVIQTASGQRALAPRTHQFSPKLESTRTARDERRRATHNEVERRRRDKINNWILKLSKIVPDCTPDNAKQGQNSSWAQTEFHNQSKGGILAKACDYIQELRAASARVPEMLKENERLTVELDIMKQQCEDLKNENGILRAHLQQNGITVASSITTSGNSSS